MVDRRLDSYSTRCCELASAANDHHHGFLSSLPPTTAFARRTSPASPAPPTPRLASPLAHFSLAYPTTIKMPPRSAQKKQVLLVQNPDSESDSDEAKPMHSRVYSNPAASTSSRLLDSLVILTPISPIHAGHLPYSDYSSARSSPTPPPITPAQTFPALNGFYSHPGVSNSGTNGFGEPVHTWNSHIDGHIRRPSDTQRQVSVRTLFV